MSQTAILHNAQQGHQALVGVIWPACKAMLLSGRKVALEIRDAEDAKTDKQRRYYHGYVLKTIASQAEVNGQRFDLKTWKEHFRSEYLGSKTLTTKNPMTGKKVRRRVRVSTEDLGVRGYSHLIDRVTAFAVTDLGVVFMEEWTDPETGEVYQLADMRKGRV